MPDHFNLHGTYCTLRFRLGAKVTCAERGELTIQDAADARIRLATWKQPARLSVA
jgi:hypothetical protein